MAPVECKIKPLDKEVSNWKGRLSSINLLVLISLDNLLLKLKFLFTIFTKLTT
jgi:hypothetical protein